MVDSDETIVVIGAGMAGLSTARTLHNAGLKVIVLEGRDRIGGRTWTSRKWADAPIDMGASWIHGIRGNPLTELADEANAERLETDYDNAILYSIDGDLMSDRAWNKIERFGSEVEEAAASADDVDMTIEDAIQSEIDLNALSAEDRQLLNLTVNTYIEQEYAADVSDLSAQYYEEGQVFGGNDVIFPQGYIQLVALLADGLDIRLNERVTQIAHSADGVKIETSSGTIEADRVVVTLPIGVLRHGDVAFAPPLPAEKRAAIDVIGPAVMNKVYLRFAERFWQRRPEWIIQVSEPKGVFSSWLNVAHYIDEPILLAFNVGDFGRKVETFTDDEIIAQAMQSLRTMYGDDIPDPTDFQITRWVSDPFARCSYSYPMIGFTDSTRRDLAAPVGERLLFAGEATSEEYPSTVHGAFLSGQREAERVLRFVGIPTQTLAKTFESYDATQKYSTRDRSRLGW